MTDDERAPSILTEIEKADTPLEAVTKAGELSLRRVIKLPFEIGRDILKIVMNGDMGETLSSSSSHLN